MKTSNIDSSTFDMFVRNKTTISDNDLNLLSKYNIVVEDSVYKFYDYYFIKYADSYYRIREEDIEVFLSVFASNDIDIIYENVLNDNILKLKNLKSIKNVFLYICKVCSYKKIEINYSVLEKLSKILTEPINVGELDLFIKDENTLLFVKNILINHNKFDIKNTSTLINEII